MVAIVNGRQLLSDQQISSLLTDPEWDSKMLADVKVRWKAVRRVRIHEQSVRHPESADGGEPSNNGSQSDAPRAARAWSRTCVPGMARYFVGESPMARFSQSRRQGEGQGRRREAGSEGSSIRDCGAMNKNRI